MAVSTLTWHLYLKLIVKIFFVFTVCDFRQVFAKHSGNLQSMLKLKNWRTFQIIPGFCAWNMKDWNANLNSCE